MVVDLHPDLPERRFFRAANAPTAFAWLSNDVLAFGHRTGLADTDLSSNGTIRLGTLNDGDDTYDVGVQSEVGDLVAAYGWIYAGDDLGNLTALSLDNWIDRLGPQRDHTGGCINERESHTIPCPVSAQAAGAVHAIIQITD